MIDPKTTDPRQERVDPVLGAFRALRRRTALIIACTIIASGVALTYSLSQQREYSASAALLFRDPAFDQKLFATSFLAPSTDPQREAATDLKLASLDNVAQLASARLNGRLTRQQIQAKVQVVPASQSNIDTVTATDANPAFAAKLANAYARAFIDIRRDSDVKKIAQALKSVQRQVTELPASERRSVVGSTLQERAQQLSILSSLQTGNVELAQAAFAPSSPSHPKPLRNAIVGAILGCLLGVATAFLLDRIDRRFRDVEEIEHALRRPILGLVRESPLLSPSAGFLADLTFSETEAFRSLRTNLRYFNLGKEVKSVVITSAAPGEGKTTVAWQLAAVAARSGNSVLLVEADLRNPTMRRRLPQPDPSAVNRAGLAAFLGNFSTFDEAVETLSVDDQSGEHTLDALLADAVPPNPADLLESAVMGDLLESAVERYDLIVIDTPPIGVLSDAVPLARAADGVIVVTRLNQSMRKSVIRLREQLDHLGVTVLGGVVNGAGDEGGYGYGYGYGSPEAVAAGGRSPS